MRRKSIKQAAKGACGVVTSKACNVCKTESAKERKITKPVFGLRDNQPRLKFCIVKRRLEKNNVAHKALVHIQDHSFRTKTSDGSPCTSLYSILMSHLLVEAASSRKCVNTDEFPSQEGAVNCSLSWCEYDIEPADCLWSACNEGRIDAGNLIASVWPSKNATQHGVSLSQLEPWATDGVPGGNKNNGTQEKPLPPSAEARTRTKSCCARQVQNRLTSVAAANTRPLSTEDAARFSRVLTCEMALRVLNIPKTMHKHLRLFRAYPLVNGRRIKRCTVNIINSDGSRHSVLMISTPGTPHRRFTKGWRAFCIQTGLRVGDIVHFSCNETPNNLNVSIQKQ